MAQVAKRKGSASTNGRMTKITTTVSPGTTLHTAQSSVVAGSFDEVWLYACNTSSAAVLVTVLFGGTTSPDDEIKVTIAPQTGLVLIVPGGILQGGAVVAAFAATTNVINFLTVVNQGTP